MLSWLGPSNAFHIMATNFLSLRRMLRLPSRYRVQGVALVIAFDYAGGGLKNQWTYKIWVPFGNEIEII
jgi:hypothetical protein